MSNSLCCENCFFDDWMIIYIQENGTEIEECDFCGSREIIAIETSKLKDLFRPIIYLYTPATEILMLEDLRNFDHDYNMIWNKINEDWMIFADDEIAEKLIWEMFGSSGHHDDHDPTFLTEGVLLEADFYGQHYETSEIWMTFCDEIKYKNRFNITNSINNFIKLISECFSENVKKDTEFYRARINSDKQLIPKEKMRTPPAELSAFGRMNPKGIPYLYLSNSVETCVSEVRPLSTDTLTVATFALKDDLKIVGIINPFTSPFKHGINLRTIYEINGFVKSLVNDMEKPIAPDISYLEYLPTQYFCEYIKHLGFDGIKYKSTVKKEGWNIVLFDQSKVECLDSQYISDISIQYEFSSN